MSEVTKPTTFQTLNFSLSSGRKGGGEPALVGPLEKDIIYLSLTGLRKRVFPLHFPSEDGDISSLGSVGFQPGTNNAKYVSHVYCDTEFISL